MLTVDNDELPECQRHVARARGHVEHEHVEAASPAAPELLAPVDVEEELLHGLLDHQPTPDDGCVLVRRR